MIERVWAMEGLRRVLPWLLWVGCATAHDVDAVSPGLGDEDASIGEGSAGSSGRASGGTSGQSGSSAGGRGGTAGSSAATGGRGGSGLFGGRSGGAGSGGGNLPCSPCSNAMGSMGMLTACCTQDNECGVDIGPLVGGGSNCVRQNMPGTESMDCPSYTFQGNFQLTSCCDGDGLCGVFIRMTAPLGCVDPELLGDLVSADSGGGGGMFFGGGQNQGQRERCN
jgi:hypothetical protein